MTEALILLGVVLFFGLIGWGIVSERKARANMTEEEWENRERQGSLLGASVMGLDKILRPDMEKAAAVQMDRKQGMMPGGDHQAFSSGEEPGTDDDEIDEAEQPESERH